MLRAATARGHWLLVLPEHAEVSEPAGTVAALLIANVNGQRCREAACVGCTDLLAGLRYSDAKLLIPGGLQ